MPTSFQPIRRSTSIFNLFPSMVATLALATLTSCALNPTDSPSPQWTTLDSMDVDAPSPEPAPSASSAEGHGYLRYRATRKDGQWWAMIETVEKRELMAVRFDPDSGKESFETQRFFGLDLQALRDLEDRGGGDLILSMETAMASLLWIEGLPGFQGSDEAYGVLHRQSQLLAILLSMLRQPGEKDPYNGVLESAFGNACTFAPDFDFAHCCRSHDRCYDRGGSRKDRKRCDRRLRSCLIEADYPCLARVYYAAVRAFGWLFFG